MRNKMINRVVTKLEKAGWVVVVDPNEPEELPTVVLCCSPRGKFCCITIIDKPPVSDEQVIEFAAKVISNKGLWVVYDGTEHLKRS